MGLECLQPPEALRYHAPEDSMINTLFTRRYSDGLSVTAVWEPSSAHRGYSQVGELELTAVRNEERIDCERFALSEESLAMREERTTSLTNGFVVRARQREQARH